jgi:ABC-type Na+ efflux pump permease subunit
MSTTTAPAERRGDVRPRRVRLDRQRTWSVARTELRQLIEAKDFWVPMVILGSIFFLFVPLLLLFAITRVDNINAVHQISQTLKVLPQAAQNAVKGNTAQRRAAYAIAVYLIAPVAVVVPLTISTAVGASTIVGERERGTGEFLAHSPASVHEIYLGKLIASLIPGYVTTAIGFLTYSLVVNLVVGPKVGGWFFPTAQWWILMVWVMPPFVALALSIVLRLSARVKSTAAAQQASGLVTLPLIMIAYAQSTGSIYGSIWPGVVVGAIAWLLAIVGLWRGMKAVNRGRLMGVADGM